MSRTIVILEGDQTGQELLDEALRVLHPDVIRYPLDFHAFRPEPGEPPGDRKPGGL